ncbi:hypothetical protein SAMN05444003_1475 [Cognatiyoonia sediminum]|uniref:Probable membrane transporter protein n=1 Tax=Cognatiyoonia sediminum TaxID=1508389 RepID=A0A1M5NL15_9RHOB|nr:sulfite exporter TauE/SafE family protein [Cognatiyoonia sediminum]SHG90135.1 hypothetical protein SAMN05444003_1475 [Cognatiyoonia sediminum]
MEGSVFWITAVLAAIFVGLGKGGVPVITAMAVPVLSLVISPVVAAGLLLPVFIASDVFGVYLYRKHFDRRVLTIMCAVMPIGVFIGWATVDLISEAMVTILLGLIGTVFALAMLLERQEERPRREAKIGPGIFWGTITGFTSFVSHSGATPYQVYTLPLRMPKLVFAGTVTIAFAYINLVKLIPYWALGQLNVENLQIALILMVPAILAVFAGVALVRWIPTKLFFRIVVWALLLISLKLIWDGVGRL